MRRLAAPLSSAAIALLTWAVMGHGFANYDELYALIWGRDLAHGRTPGYEVALAPTPHPLTTLQGLLLAPLDGREAERAAVVLAFLFLGILGYVVYRLGHAWFGAAAGVVAAALVLTREPVLSYGVRAYLDIPYCALVLGALLAETRRPRNGWRTLWPLAVAGLLRPEAWLFAGAYVVWLWWRGERDGRRLLGLCALALAAPVIWMLSDLLVTGDPLWSFSGTREGAEELRRATGIDDVPITLPRRIGETVREPVLLGAALGAALLWWRRRAVLALPAAGLVLALAAFALLGAAGLPIITRYGFLAGALLILLCAATLTGWRAEADPRARGWWMAGAAVTALVLLALAPQQARRIDRLQAAIATQDRIQADAFGLEGPLGDCLPVGVPNHRGVPVVALAADIGPDQVRAADHAEVVQIRGQYLQPATPRLARAFLLDPRDAVQRLPAPPADFAVVARNRSWRLLERC
jgi:hypothetical protein